MVCCSHIKIWNISNHMKQMKKKNQTLSFQFFINKSNILMFFVSLFHVVCKISNFDTWTTKHLAQPSCTELTLHWKEYKIDSLFLFLGQNLLTNYLLIYFFCTSYEPEIIMLVLQMKNNIRFITLSKINKESIVNFLLLRRNYGSFSYSFSCKIHF